MSPAFSRNHKESADTAESRTITVTTVGHDSPAPSPIDIAAAPFVFTEGIPVGPPCELLLLLAELDINPTAAAMLLEGVADDVVEAVLTATVSFPAKSPYASISASSTDPAELRFHQVWSSASRAVLTIFQLLLPMRGNASINAFTEKLVSSCSRMMRPGDLGPLIHAVRLSLT